MTAYPWTSEIDAEIIAARVRGELLRVIATRLGTSRTTLSAHLKKLDPALVSRPRAVRPKPGPKPQVSAGQTPGGGPSEVHAAREALKALRKREGLDDDKAERDARIAARRAANDARVQRAHQVSMQEHQPVILTYEVLARRHVRSA
jgi:hypothetical protein